jgi:Uma2 family endonuclease
MATDYALRLFTVEEYHRMYDLGIIGPDERVELLDGEIIARPAVNPPHGGIIKRFDGFLNARFYPRATVSIQMPVRTDDRSEPQPDIALIRFRDDFYEHAHPTPADTFALIEVSDSRLSYDRGKKLKNYARARIAEYWIANVRDRVLEIYREPNDLGYELRHVFAASDSIAFLAFPDDVFKVADLIGG